MAEIAESGRWSATRDPRPPPPIFCHVPLSSYLHQGPSLLTSLPTPIHTMARSEQTEPFPPIQPSRKDNPSGLSSGSRRRRKSSNLGDDPRGDTGTVSLATAFDNQSPTKEVRVLCPLARNGCH